MSTGAKFDPQLLYEETVRVYKRIAPPVRTAAGCLYWALSAVIASRILKLDKLGYNFQIQAGSAVFVCIDPESDDGTIQNAFGYEFEVNSETIEKVARHEMPEMHCWAGCAKTGTIFDPTTGFQPEQCRKTAGIEWTAPVPPPFVCFTRRTAPLWAIYTPSMDATGLAHYFIEDFIRVSEAVLGSST